MAALYETTVRTTGGRNGHAESTDGWLKVDLAAPPALGGNGQGTNPEQLFGAGYACCFEGAMRYVARPAKLPVQDVRIDATVGLVPEGDQLKLAVTLAIETTGLTQEQAEDLVRRAHAVCPYSNATRGNVDVKLSVVAK